MWRHPLGVAWRRPPRPHRPRENTLSILQGGNRRWALTPLRHVRAIPPSDNLAMLWGKGWQLWPVWTTSRYHDVRGCSQIDARCQYFWFWKPMNTMNHTHDFSICIYAHIISHTFMHMFPTFTHDYDHIYDSYFDVLYVWCFIIYLHTTTWY